MERCPCSLTPEQISELVRSYVNRRLERVAASTHGPGSSPRFTWCGDVLDFLVEGLDEYVADSGLTFESPFPGPVRLWDEDQHPDGEHVRRFWVVALDRASSRPVAKLLTIFFHRHDRAALPRPPQIVAFPPTFRVDEEDPGS